MGDGRLPEVHYSNGAFLLFDMNHALLLRRRRILSQPVAGNPAAGPHCLSPQAARVVASNGLATFKQLKLKQTISTEENKTKHELKLGLYIGGQKELFIAQRLAELKRRNVTPTPRTIGQFDESKTRLPINDTPDLELSTFEINLMRNDDVIRLVDDISDQKLAYVYDDLYKRGFYVSSGMKFGSNFLAYLDDPVRYHAQYAIRLVPGDELGLVDLNELNFCEINSLQRLTHGANKVPLLVTVILADQQRASPKISYWTLKERVYLAPDSKKTDFDPIEPNMSCPTRLEGIGNKVRKTS